MMNELVIHGDADKDRLQWDVSFTINELLDERKLRWCADTVEFTEGLLIGLELAGIYGKKIQKIYPTST